MYRTHSSYFSKIVNRFCIPRAMLAVIVLLPVLALSSSACAPRVATHGFMPRDELINQLSPGQQDKGMVQQLMGSPSSIGTFDEDTWYYITQRTENKSFFRPMIIDQTVLALVFDDQDVLQSIVKYGLEEAQLIEPLEKKTPTVGRKLTILQQLFGNFGRFSDPNESSTLGP